MNVFDFDNTIYFPEDDNLTKDNIESIKKFITKKILAPLFGARI